MKKRVTFTLEEDLMALLKEVSHSTMIPQARIVEMAIKEKLTQMDPDRAIEKESKPRTITVRTQPLSEEDERRFNKRQIIARKEPIPDDERFNKRQILWRPSQL